MYLRSNSRRLVTQKIGHPAAALIDSAIANPIGFYLSYQAIWMPRSSVCSSAGGRQFEAKSVSATLLTVRKRTECAYCRSMFSISTETGSVDRQVRFSSSLKFIPVGQFSGFLITIWRRSFHLFVSRPQSRGEPKKEEQGKRRAL